MLPVVEFPPQASPEKGGHLAGEREGRHNVSDQAGMLPILANVEVEARENCQTWLAVAWRRYNCDVDRYVNIVEGKCPTRCKDHRHCQGRLGVLQSDTEVWSQSEFESRMTAKTDQGAEGG